MDGIWANGSTDIELFASSLPLTDSAGSKNAYTVNNGGAWTFTANTDGSIDVSVSGATLYNENGELHAPTLKGNGTVISPSPSQGNIYLSSAFFELVVPTEKDTTINKKFELMVTDSDMSVPYKDGLGQAGVSITQTDKTNDSVTRDYENLISGSYGLFHYIAKENQQSKFWGNNLSSNKSGMGLDAYALKENVVQIVGAFSYSGDGIKNLNAVNMLMRIDDKAVQPSESSSTGTPTSNNITGKTKLLYATKKGGTGWSSDEEMLKTKEDDLEYFESMSALKKQYPDGVCVAVLAEIRDIKNINENQQYTLGFNVDVLTTAQENTVYQTVHTIAFYNTDKNITEKDTRLDNKNNTKLNQYTSYLRENNDYEKAQYDDEHQVINGNSANSSYIRGASLMIVGVEAGIEKTVDAISSTFDLSSGITFIPYRLQPVLNVTENKDGTTIKEMIITDILPNQLKVTPDTKYYYGDQVIVPDVEEQSDGTTKIIWTIENVKTGETLPAITFKAEINFVNIDLKQAKHTISNTSYIEADGDNRVFSSEWESHPNKSTTQATLVVNKSLNLSKQVLEPVIEINGDVRYRIAFTNTNALDYENYKMLDVLPFNGDLNGSKFDGSYTTEVKLTAPSSIELCYSKSEKVRNKDVSNVDASLFEVIAPTSDKDGYKYYKLPENTTAVMLVGTLPTMTQYILDVTLHSNENNGENIYGNSASMVADGLSKLTTPVARAEVIERNLSGIAWFDSNKNGLMDSSEEKIANLVVNLYKTSPVTGLEEPATDVSGNQCTTKTDADGKYKFEKLSSGTYRIEFIDENGTPISIKDYSITAKNVGDDDKINSKADAILNGTGIMSSAEIAGIEMPTLEKMQSDNVKIFNRDYQNVGIYKILISKTVAKVWDDNNNQDGIRPDEVKIQLYGNGKAVGTEVILNEANNWKHTFSNLAKFENGKEIEYTIKEVDVPNGYTEKVEISKDGNFMITNTSNSDTAEKLEKPENKPTEKPNEIPQTGDATNVGLLGMIFAGSGGMLLGLFHRKRKKSRK